MRYCLELFVIISFSWSAIKFLWTELAEVKLYFFIKPPLVGCTFSWEWANASKDKTIFSIIQKCVTQFCIIYKKIHLFYWNTYFYASFIIKIINPLFFVSLHNSIALSYLSTLILIKHWGKCRALAVNIEIYNYLCRFFKINFIYASIINI